MTSPLVFHKVSLPACNQSARSSLFEQLWGIVTHYDSLDYREKRLVVSLVVRKLDDMHNRKKSDEKEKP